ncbi:MAG: 2-hydroxyacid dehydrogenase [Candidatus Omnitrophota bacterium]
MIAFFDTKPYDRASFDETNRKYGFDIRYIPVHLTAQSAELAKGCEVICAFVNDVIDQEVIGILKRLGVKLIALRSAGYNNVDLKAAYGNLHVVRVPAYSPHAVAEHAVALILGLNRRIPRAYHRVRDGNFSIHGLMGFDLYGKTAGVIGTGKIGRCLVTILRGFGMRVLAYDTVRDDAFAAQSGCRYAPLEEIYAESDILSLHCPLTPETHRMIDERSIARMKTGVMLINTSRGKLVDTKALIEGLKSGKVGYAGLDVYEEEADYFFEDFSASLIEDDVLARLLTFPNVLITSHQAFFTREAMANIAETTLANIAAFVKGDPLVNEVCKRCQ